MQAHRNARPIRRSQLATREARRLFGGAGEACHSHGHEHEVGHHNNSHDAVTLRHVRMFMNEPGSWIAL